jgi:glutaredoxin
MGGKNSSNYRSIVEKQIKENPVLMYSATYCGYCTKAMNVFSTIRVTPFVIYLDKDPDGDEIALALYEITGQDTVPSIFIGGKHIGGFSQLVKGLSDRSVQAELNRIGVRFEDFGG